MRHENIKHGVNSLFLLLSVVHIWILQYGVQCQELTTVDKGRERKTDFGGKGDFLLDPQPRYTLSPDVDIIAPKEADTIIDLDAYPGHMDIGAGPGDGKGPSDFSPRDAVALGGTFGEIINDKPMENTEANVNVSATPEVNATVIMPTSGMPINPLLQKYPCEARNECQHKLSQSVPDHLRNCYCDPLCVAYRDCCKDHDDQKHANISKLPPHTFSCRIIPSIDPYRAFSVIDRCPKSYKLIEVKSNCEEGGAKGTDQLLHVPVSGGESGILYRNIFCAACHNEKRPVAWITKLDCESFADPEVNETDVTLPSVREILAKAERKCKTHYTKPTGGTTRECRADIKANCAHDYDKSKIRRVRRKCRNNPPLYVHLGFYTFRNKHCAICHHINQSLLSCASVSDSESPAPTRRPTPPPELSLTMNINKWSATISAKTGDDPGDYKNSPVVIPKNTCEGNQIYDPFKTSCRLYRCQAEEKVREGKCVAMGTDRDNPTTKRPRGSGNKRKKNKNKNRSPPEAGTKAPSIIESYTPQVVTVGDCDRIYLNDSSYVQLTNQSILANDKIYEPGEYRNDYGLVSICKDAGTSLDEISRRNVSHIIVMFNYNRIQDMLSFVGIIVSMCGLLIVFAVHLILSQLRNIIGKSLMCLVFSLFIAQGLLQFGHYADEHGLACLVVGAAMHYWWMAAFFWINVISFDVWRCFATRVMSPSGGCRFFVYSLYGWIGPALIVGTSFGLEYLPVDDMYRPHYGARGFCWITQRYSLLFLFALPLATMVATNVVFYFMTAVNMCLMESTQDFEESLKCQMLLYVKMCFIMAITWVFGFLGTLMDMNVMWYVFIAFNILHGVFACFAFTCTRRVYKLFRAKLLGASKSYDTRAATNGYHPSNGRRTFLSFENTGAKVVSQETSI